MIDLKNEIEQLIEQSEEYEKQNYIELVYTDLSVIDYYWPSIVRTAEELIQYDFDQWSFKLSQDQAETLRDWILDSIQNEDLELKIGYGYWVARESVSLVSCEEIEICLPEYWHITKWKTEAVNRFTDLYISDSSDQYGYYACQFYVYFDLDSDKLNELLNLGFKKD